MSDPFLFCFGYGYCAAELGRTLGGGPGPDWRVGGTVRDEDGMGGEIDGLSSGGPSQESLHVFSRSHLLPLTAFEEATHLLVSIAPDEHGDVVLDLLGEEIASLKNLKWLGYLSTTGVYGDHGGASVDEETALCPTGERGHRRLAAERGWLDLLADKGVPVHIFRLAGIYGPGRNALELVRAGKAKRIVKAGQVFSRIHVGDLATVLRASMAALRPGAVYNVCDDEAAPPQDVIVHACDLLGVAPPPQVFFDDADLSPMGKSFYQDNKRVSNARIKEELGITLSYRDYRAGLAALFSALPKEPA